MFGCNTSKVPTAQISQYELVNKYKLENDKLEVYIQNTLRCPVRFWIQPKDIKLKRHFDTLNPITLKPLKDSTITVKVNNLKKEEITFASRLGDTNQLIAVNKVELPFQKNKEYKLIQGYNSNPTHNTDWSRYALDFGLAIGDTICSATPGYVVGVVEDYKYGGEGKEWKSFGNYITIYDKSSGLYTQYVHLKYKSSLVNIGDKVEAGQSIGLAGMTGRTNIEHLHFNCLKPVHSEDGLISIPIDSIGRYKVSNLKRNEVLRN